MHCGQYCGRVRWLFFYQWLVKYIDFWFVFFVSFFFKCVLYPPKSVAFDFVQLPLKNWNLVVSLLTFEIIIWYNTVTGKTPIFVWDSGILCDFLLAKMCISISSRDTRGTSFFDKLGIGLLCSEHSPFCITTVASELVCLSVCQSYPILPLWTLSYYLALLVLSSFLPHFKLKQRYAHAD